MRAKPEVSHEYSDDQPVVRGRRRLFIFGLKQLGSPATAVRGNVLSSLAMVIAIAVTLLNKEILTFELIIGCCLHWCCDWRDSGAKG